ncbi:hypothetical protein FD09_GL000299 [Schleiferilactobacillus perolens DSM 12744]|uniref:DUF1828 domain-containing protein n=2 Tax=Schleiferilactobacillus perolens TaxID=100468 RepID=A0A0R1N9V0_9LACO|nr:hypothetical protein FD09_GL000299 [Schleiferilactobacillus perolens DSM 12744]
MMTDQWITDYTMWLRKQYHVESLPDGDEVTTPFTNSLGDNIQLFMIPSTKDGEFLLTDEGNTINDLELLGINMNNDTRSELLSSIVQQYQVSLDKEGVLSVSGPIKNFPVLKQHLLQAVLRIDDLSQTRKGVVSNIFRQEVGDYLSKNEFEVLPNYPIQGRTGNPYHIDYAIGGTESKPLRLIQVVPRPSFDRVAAESVTFDDIKKNEALNSHRITYTIIFNDETSKVSKSAYNIASRYGTEIVPWSDKKQLFNLR